MTFARAVFAIVGIAGIAALLVRIPTAEDWSDHAISATLLAWQIVFFVIASDPVRFRPVMIPAALEKLLYVTAVLGLAFTGKIPEGDSFIGGVIVHGTFGVLFAVAFVLTRPASSTGHERASPDPSSAS